MSGNMLLIIVVAIAAIALDASPFTRASDPDKLQDFCVAVKDSEAKVFVNGKICKNINEVNAGDFYLQAQFNNPRNTSNRLRYMPSPIGVEILPGLNTQGVSIGRMDFGPYGMSPPHTHIPATEVITVLEGTIYAGFIDSRNKLYAKTLRPGDIFVFPKGLIRFLYNTGGSNAAVFAALGSQDPGAILIPYALFGTDPPIFADVLSKAFLLDKNVISHLQSEFRSELSK
ncbi:unnamed protein product [Cuscuta epithymum]|uniref:Germin-like protein n=1 Tax=Cuscuta epithymum TaxID=186058 RepID=A0AAV0GCW0_9ASTE|nr:unnamed protein product [Cuscuta epithymum]